MIETASQAPAAQPLPPVHALPHGIAAYLWLALLMVAAFVQLIAPAVVLLAGMLLLAWWPGRSRSGQIVRVFLAAGIGFASVLSTQLTGHAGLGALFPVPQQLSLLLLGGGLLVSLRRDSLAQVCAGFASLTWVLLAITWRGADEVSGVESPGWAALFVHVCSALVWIQALRLPQQPRPLFVVSAAALIGLAVWILLALALRMPGLQRDATPDALPLFTAVLLFSAGAGLLQSGRGKRRSMWWWLAPFFLLMPPLLLESMSVDLGIFGLAPHLVRLSPEANAALPLTLFLTLLVGVLGTLAVAAPGVTSMRRDAISWACGLLLLMIAAIVLIGLASGLSSFEQLVMPAPMVVLIAIGLCCFGIGLCAAGLQTTGLRSATVLLPVMVAFSGLVLAIPLSLAVRNRIDQQNRQLGAQLVSELQHGLDTAVARHKLSMRHVLSHMTDHGLSSSLAAQAEFPSHASQLLQERPNLQWALLLDAEQRVLAQQGALADARLRQVLAALRDPSTPALVESGWWRIDAGLGLLAVRLDPPESRPGMLLAGLSIERLLTEICAERMTLLSGIRIRSAETQLYRQGTVTRSLVRTDAQLLGQPVQVEFWLPERDAGLPLPMLLLLSCVLLACALAVAIRMGAIARERNRQAEAAHRDLELRVAEREHAYALLHDSEADLHRVLHSISDAFYVLDEHWRFIFVNPQAECLLRHSREALLGQNVWSSFPELAQSELRPVYERAVREASTEQFEFYFEPWHSWLSLRAYPQRRGLAVYFRDVTESKQAEFELARLNRALRMRTACSEALIRTQHESALLTAICEVVVDAGGYRMAWVGYAQDDLERTIQPMVSAGHVDGYLDEIQISWSASAAAGAGPAGRAIRSGKIECCADIEAEDTGVIWLNAARQRGYRSIVSLPLRHGNRVFGVLNLYRSEVHSASTDEQDLLIALADDLAHGIHGLRAESEQRMLHLAALKMATFAGADGSNVLQQIAVDLCELLGADAALIGRVQAGANGHLRILARAGGSGAWVTGPDVALLDTDTGVMNTVLRQGEFIIGSGAHEQLGTLNQFLGWPAQHFIGVRLDHPMHALRGVVAVLFKRPMPVNGFHLASLRMFAVRIAAEIARLDANAVIRRHARLLDEAHDAIMTVDESGLITYCNASALQRYGWTDRGLLGQSLTALYPEVEQALASTAFATVMQQGTWVGEAKHCRSDGQLLEVETRLTRVQEVQGECSVLVISTDIGARKQAQRQLEQTLVKLHERNGELREFAFVASHDLQEPLRKVRAYAERLTQRYHAQFDARGQDYFLRINSAVGRMQRLIDDLLAYSRVLSGQRQSRSVDLAELVREVLSDLEVLLRETHAQVSIGASGLPVVQGDPTQLRQLFQNLLGNALKYRKPGRVPQVHVECATVERAGTSFWEITISDNGIGFAMEHAQQIFAPFQRLHGRAEYEGSGIGLAIVRRVVESRGGSISAVGVPDEGATFTVYWPIETQEASPVGAVTVGGEAQTDPEPERSTQPAELARPAAKAALDSVLEAVRLGVPNAERQLYERFAPQVRALLRRHRNLPAEQLDAEMSRVFVQLRQRVQEGHWPNAMAFMQELRAMLSQDQATPDASLAAPSNSSDAAQLTPPATAAAPLDERLQQTVQRLLAELPETLERETLLRFYVQVQSPEQICAELNLPPEQLRQLLQQVRKRIRESL